MKYIITWIFFTYHALPQCNMGTICIDGREETMYCAVAHGQFIPHDSSYVTYNKDSAMLKIKHLYKEYDDQFVDCISFTPDGRKVETKHKLWRYVDSIKIDSVVDYTNAISGNAVPCFCPKINLGYSDTYIHFYNGLIFLKPDTLCNKTFY